MLCVLAFLLRSSYTYDVRIDRETATRSSQKMMQEGASPEEVWGGNNFKKYRYRYSTVRRTGTLYGHDEKILAEKMILLYRYSTVYPVYEKTRRCIQYRYVLHSTGLLLVICNLAKQTSRLGQ